MLNGLADAFGVSKVPLYVMNVTYPLVDKEFVRFCAGKKAILVVEEGGPDYIEQAVNTILRRADIQTRVHGKDVLPMAGEYTGGVVREGIKKFIAKVRPDLLPATRLPPETAPLKQRESKAAALVANDVHGRPPSFCTGCPERPIFAAMKLVERELGTHHVSADIGCHLFSIFPPFNVGATTMGYGLGAAGASALNVKAGKRAISMMGDGGFWHNGLTSGVGNAVFNKSDNVLIIVDNGYSAATGGQDIPSSFHAHAGRSTQNSIEKAVRGVGVTWAKTINHTYDVALMRDTLARGADHDGKRPEGHHRALRMHAEQAAPHPAAVAQGRGRRRARGARAVRRRCRHLHRRSFLHPAVGLPVADHRAEPRSAAPRAGHQGDQLLRRLRAVRRGEPRRGAVPVVLPRLADHQPDRLGSLQGAHPRRRDRLLPAAHRAPACGGLIRWTPPRNARSPSPSSPWAAKAAACWRNGSSMSPSTPAISRR